METIVVVTHTKDWPLNVPGVCVVDARTYLTNAQFIALRRAKVYNLCRQYRYQSLGYYVSLLAEARGHKPIPSVMTLQDLRTPTIARTISDEIEAMMRRSLESIRTSPFVLSIYFGKNLAQRHARLANAFFRLFPAPLLRATFVRHEKWELQSLSAFPASDIPDDHYDFVITAAKDYFRRQIRPVKRMIPPRFDLAILWSADDLTAPSGKQTIDHFIHAAEKMAMSAEIIGQDDYGRLAEFDGLFIRTTTAVNHYTYRFSRRAAADGIVVIDDPVSILRCTNKVYLAELFERKGIPQPKTWIIHKDNYREPIFGLSFPCIIKKPDSSSSLGVFKAEDLESLHGIAQQMFTNSELLIVQEYMPTEFDWRIGVLDRRPFFAAKYFMAPRHWQIINNNKKTFSQRYGDSIIIPVEEVPSTGLKCALRVAELIGDGLYGVDLKQMGKKWYVIEINDNPNIDHGVENRHLGDEIYRRMMGVFIRRIEAKKNGILVS